MKQFKVQFECDNAAFDVFPHRAIADVLRDVAQRIEREGVYANSAQWILDINGNRVGTFKYEER